MIRSQEHHKLHLYLCQTDGGWIWLGLPRQKVRRCKPAGLQGKNIRLVGMQPATWSGQDNVHLEAHEADFLGSGAEAEVGTFTPFPEELHGHRGGQVEERLLLRRQSATGVG